MGYELGVLKSSDSIGIARDQKMARKGKYVAVLWIPDKTMFLPKRCFQVGLG